MLGFKNNFKGKKIILFFRSEDKKYQNLLPEYSGNNLTESNKSFLQVYSEIDLTKAKSNLYYSTESDVMNSVEAFENDLSNK